jgi:hypothetical protein
MLNWENAMIWLIVLSGHLADRAGRPAGSSPRRRPSAVA